MLPLRVKTFTAPEFVAARQRITPQVATVPASRTSDSNVPRRAGDGESANSFPGLLAAPTIRPEGSRRSAVTWRAAGAGEERRPRRIAADAEDLSLGAGADEQAARTVR